MRDSLKKVRRVSIATGVASYPMISRLAEQLSSFINNLEISVYEIKNNFYGESITVSGLLTGFDIYNQLKDKELGDELFIPANCLRDGEDVFLCGMTLDKLRHKLAVKISVSENDGYEFVRDMLGAD